MAWYWWVLIGLLGLATALLLAFLGLMLWIFYGKFARRDSFLYVDPDLLKSAGPPKVAVATSRLRSVDPYLAEDPKKLAAFIQALPLCDERPAFVVSTDPFVVAAHSHSLDAVVLVAFDRLAVPRTFRVKKGARLLCAMGYQWTTTVKVQRVAPDIIEGVGSYGAHSNLIPIILDLLVADPRELDALKQTIPESDWAYAREMVDLLLESAHAPPRDGRPSMCHIPSTGRRRWACSQVARAIMGLARR
jgi:hypothetical protein